MSLELAMAGAGAGASLLGAGASAREAGHQGRMNRNMQKLFAQRGIQWKVADSKAAGINPLVALGAQTHSFSPQRS